MTRRTRSKGGEDRNKGREDDARATPSVQIATVKKRIRIRTRMRSKGGKDDARATPSVRKATVTDEDEKSNKDEGQGWGG